jgi:superfamily II DNA or RNA helicase
MREDAPPPGFTVDLFSDDQSPLSSTAGMSWPDGHRFPLNLDAGKVKDVVLPDLKRAESALLVSGYASLDRLIDFVATCPDESRPRVMIGHEPHPSRRETYELTGKSLPLEVEHYWLERGVSLHLSAKLLHFIERLKGGVIQARYLPGDTPLHAKIYVGDDGATIGSSNFTESGLRLQMEANARFSATQERVRYAELKQIAENLWTMGRDYRDELIALLEQLLRVVPWQEALARACAELLEGEWAERYLRGDYLADAASLWPSQRQGIAQALYVLSHQGSVLVADATGSGKTRMGVHLIGAILDQILRKGRLRQGKAIMVCPPIVESSWEMESHLAAVPLDTYSHGKLSHSRSRRHELTIEALRRAQIMCVDEGHNFLNFKAQRTQHLLRNMADHVLLFTATPINKSVVDLLRIADMLGADNLEPSTLKAFKKMLGVRNINRSLTEQEIETLRKEIQRFTVRRTKKVLNGLIEREPEHYVDKNGRQCRFPQHKPIVYTLDEPANDRELAQQIRDLADQLIGATHFVKTIEMPEILRQQGVSEESFLQGRLNSAKKLARYVVTSSLRSSRAALVEHLVGTHQAIAQLSIKRFKKSNATGDVLGQLGRIAGSPPKNKLRITLPDWLTDPIAHKAACDRDAATYGAILDLVMRLSGQRERRKATHLIGLLKTHQLVLAFDGRPITLAVIRQLIEEMADKVTVVVATGDADSERAFAMETFRLGSKKKRTIGLCSDSLSEGVNLQQASALVHLDMPTVVRIAEQRVGRVDRMDSPHEIIEAWWPEDASEFALSTDERFIERYETVESLLGSNMPLPDAMQRHDAPVRTEKVIEDFERQAEIGAWDGIQDAFEPVRQLAQGPVALVPRDAYERYRHISARVLSRVSVVRSKAPWAFFCLTGGSFGAPRWILLPGLKGAPVTELGNVCAALRERLTYETENLLFDERGASVLTEFLNRLDEAERSLLPRRKQRALEEMRIVVEKLAEAAGATSKQQDVDHLVNIMEMLDRSVPSYQPDWDAVAGRWLDVIRPVWFEMLTKRKRSRPLLLKDIRNELLARGPWLTEQILHRFREFPVLPGPEERVKACIVGVS